MAGSPRCPPSLACAARQAQLCRHGASHPRQGVQQAIAAACHHGDPATLLVPAPQLPACLQGVKGTLIYATNSAGAGTITLKQAS
jgi:hypothetical protein